jgi:alpha-ketoglutarate-dependent taurine dioxygenase
MNILTKTTLPQTFTVTPIKPHIGAEITGIDLTQAVDEVPRQAL